MWECRNVRARIFLHINICKSIYICVHYIHATSEKEKMGEREKQQAEWPDAIVDEKVVSRSSER
jgi:hypothetical protein